MRVLCIKTPKPSNEGIIPVVKEGDDAHVLETKAFDFEDGRKLDFYILKEHSEAWYPASCFIPLDGPDETDYADKVLDGMFQKV
jgi:hypothetical protein